MKMAFHRIVRRLKIHSDIAADETLTFKTFGSFFDDDLNGVIEHEVDKKAH